jgi:hypothetical protein
MPEENGDGKNKTGVLEKAKDSAAALRETLTEKAKQQAAELKEPEKTQLYRSIFRVKHDEEPRNRALAKFHWIFASGRSAGILGCHCGNEYGASHAAVR